MARPMPDAAPVTTATLPSSFPLAMNVSSLWVSQIPAAREGDQCAVEIRDRSSPAEAQCAGAYHKPIRARCVLVEGRDVCPYTSMLREATGRQGLVKIEE